MKYLCLPFLLLLILLQSCNYYVADFPISPKSGSSIDTTLLGKWYVLEQKKGDCYIDYELDVLVLSDAEYAIIETEFKNRGKKIDETSLIRVHSTKLNNGLYFNCDKIGEKLVERYHYYRLEQNFGDSLHLRYLTDSLKLNFETPEQFKDYLENEKKIGKKGHWTPMKSLYRRETIHWDRINCLQKSSQFRNFYLIGYYKKEKFMQLTDDEIREKMKITEPQPIADFTEYFKNIYWDECSFFCFKQERFGVIELDSGQLIRIRVDENMGTFEDLSNDRFYKNKNENLGKSSTYK